MYEILCFFHSPSFGCVFRTHTKTFPSLYLFIALPPEIRHLTHLQTLNLADNQFPYFPPQLCLLPHLTSIPNITRNPLQWSNWPQARAWIALQKSCSPPSLQAICAAIVLRQARTRGESSSRREHSVTPKPHAKRKLDSELTLPEIRDRLPALMASYLDTGHLCESCGGFIPSTDLDQSLGNCSGADRDPPVCRPTVFIETIYHFSQSKCISATTRTPVQIGRQFCDGCLGVHLRWGTERRGTERCGCMTCVVEEEQMIRLGKLSWVRKGEDISIF